MASASTSSLGTTSVGLLRAPISDIEIGLPNGLNNARLLEIERRILAIEARLDGAEDKTGVAL